MKTYRHNTREQGFFKILLIIIIAAAIATFMGYNPLAIWDLYIVPVLVWLWDVLYKIISFLIEIVMSFILSLRA